MAKRTNKTISVPARFEPRFWEDVDNRCAVVKAIQRRYEGLKADTGCDSMQKDILCQQATFLLVWLETCQRRALEDGVFDGGSYMQSVNSLLGLLRALGLEKCNTKVVNLQNYVAERSA